MLTSAIRSIIKFVISAMPVIKYIVLLFIVWLVISFLQPMADSFSRLLDRLSPEPTVEIISGQTIMSSLRGIGDLITVTSDDHTTEFHVGIREGILGWGSYGADHTAHGIIEASIDFTQLRSSGLVCGDICVMTVPHPTITRCIVTRLRQSEQSLALGWRDWETLEEFAHYQAIEEFINKVQEPESPNRPILDLAKEQTELLLGELVAGLMQKPVDVVFADAPVQLVTGATCQPSFPEEYQRDENGEWRKAN